MMARFIDFYSWNIKFTNLIEPYTNFLNYNHFGTYIHLPNKPLNIFR